MKSSAIIVFSIFIFGLFCGISGAAESDVGLEKYFQEAGSYDVLKRNHRAQNSTHNDQYIFEAGYAAIDEENPTEKVPYLVVMDLHTRAFLSEVKLDVQIKSMCATKNYLYIIHFVEAKKHVDTTGHLRVFDISDINKIKLLDHELAFQINDGTLLVDNNNMVLVAEIYAQMEITTRIFRIGLEDPSKPALMSSSFIAVKDVDWLTDQSGKPIKDSNGKPVYTSTKDVYHQIIGDSSIGKLDGESLYFVLNNDIWSFDLEGRDKDGVKGNPDETRPYYTGKISSFSYQPDDILDRIYDYCWTNAEKGRFGKARDYFFIIGEARSEFDFIEEGVGERTHNRPVIKYGIFVLDIEHYNSMGGSGESVMTMANKVSQLELPIIPSRVFSKDNWVFVTGYEKVFDEKTGRNFLKGRICILDSSIPKEIKLVDVIKLDSMFVGEIIGDQLFASDGQTKGLIYDITLENKGFTKEIPHKMSRSQKNKERQQAKMYPPRVYTYRYRGFDHAYRNKVSWLKGKPPETRVLSWLFGYSMKGIIIYDWDDAPPEMAQQFRDEFLK